MLPQTGGHLYSIHDQKDYDKLKAASVGYTKPIMIGLHSDSAGNWEWTDGSPFYVDVLAETDVGYNTGCPCKQLFNPGGRSGPSARRAGLGFP